MSILPPPLPPEHLRDPGDAWVEGPDGKKYWGKFGAAGLLVMHPPRGVLLQLRAEWSHHGGTWGIPGGALKYDEDAVSAALREAHEEAGVPTESVVVLDTHLVDLGFWSYTTVLGRSDEYFEPQVTDHESAAVEWVPLEQVSTRDLHPAFGSAWLALREVLERAL